MRSSTLSVRLVCPPPVSVRVSEPARHSVLPQLMAHDGIVADACQHRIQPGVHAAGSVLVLSAVRLCTIDTESTVPFACMQNITSSSCYDVPPASGINLTFYVQQLLELRSATRSAAGRVPTSKVGRHFLTMLEENENAFAEVYVASFEALDRIWLERYVPQCLLHCHCHLNM